jgi:uncharacterized protein YidB (DUF937 family)
MGLFDQIVAGLSSGSGSGTAPAPVALMEMLSNHEGGLGGLLQKFNAAGLGETVQSWVGQGQNLPISAETIQQVLGSDMMQQFAARTGLPLEQVSTMVAEHLPHVVDGLTPNGQVETGGNSLFAAGAALLKSRFGIG